MRPPTPCPRAFEAEAMRDGRLAGAERVSFERHMTVCLVCRHESRALDSLAEALHATPEDNADELHVRRERTRLLAAFDRVLVSPDHRWGAGRRLLWPAAVVALVAGLLVFWRSRPAVQPVHASNAVVHVDSTTVWSERTEGNRERVTLERGALWIHVDHSSGAGRLVVVLPDGELEDTGTTFTVSAQDGHTTRVAVQDGSVVLRIRGQSSVAIGPGETWIPDSRPAASGCASAPPAEPTPSGRASPPAPTAPPPRSREPLTSALEPDPSLDFRTAMAALDVGDNVGAAAGFASFLLKHPQDPRAEDAAYLRVIALQRGGDTDRMKEAAQDYLGRYPAGFRHGEVQSLTR